MRTYSSEYIVDNIKKIIKEEYQLIGSVDDITSRIFVSSPYASRVFKRETGKSIHNYLISVRISEAKKLLRDPRNRAYEVALEVGYTTSAYFSTSFKNNTGYTPIQFQELYAKTVRCYGAPSRTSKKIIPKGEANDIQECRAV